MKEIRYILVLVIGGTLFWVGTGLFATHLRPPHADWIRVIPDIDGRGSMNLTTSTLEITGEKWEVHWGSPPSPAQCVVEVYNASTDEKLQEFTLSSGETKELNITGSFYLKIQVYGSEGPWYISMSEYKPTPIRKWIAWIAVIGIASLVVFFGYKKLRRAQSSTSDKLRH